MSALHELPPAVLIINAVVYLVYHKLAYGFVPIICLGSALHLKVTSPMLVADKRTISTM